jgi:hypothetical protein
MKHTHKCIAERTEQDLILNFLDYFNNFLSIERFAEYYGLKRFEALMVINAGREAHEKTVTEGKK